MQSEQNKKIIETMWDNDIIPALQKFITIPNKSPAFDPEWEEHGYMDQAVKFVSNWCKKIEIPGLHVETIKLPNRTPVILITVPGQSDETVLLYGHLDKQPEMSGWDEELGPWKPVLKNDRLYGRGAADDGYAAFAALTAIYALHQQGLPYARCVILIEACEESGSYDLPYYIDALKDKIGEPNLIICLDSGCGNYDQLWMTTSLRGLVSGTLHVDVLKQGIHSGFGSGNVPSPVMIMRQLLDRIEDKTNGQILLNDFFIDIPEERFKQAHQTARILGESIIQGQPLLEGVHPVTHDLPELLLNRTWRPALSVIGIEGLPSIKNAGNVTIPSLSVKLSFRVPPLVDTHKALNALKKALEINPPFHAKVHFEATEASDGWNAPPTQKWLAEATSQASQNYFGAPAAYIGEGASIPFMGMLGKKFPKAQFVITGVLGPESNAHGPNEFLHIPTGKKLTCCIADIVAKHFHSDKY